MMAAGDFNGDGVPDIVTTDSTGGVDVFIANGDGSFKSYVKYTAGSGPLQVVIGDINGDGKPDIVSANSGSNTISVLPGNGDGTFQTQQTYPTGSFPAWIAIGDWNGDARTDLAIANKSGNSVSIYLGILTPVLTATSTHTSNFSFGATGTYTLTAANLGPGVTVGTVTLVDTLPSGLTGASMSGTGWNCTLATLTCTRSDALLVGASYAPVTLVVNVALSASSPAVNIVNVSSAGAVSGNGSDSTTITSGPPYPVLTAPANQATGVPLTATLFWAASQGATSYDVYFGTTSPPVFVATVTGTSYSASLAAEKRYYWQVVAKNSSGAGASPIWSFATLVNGGNVGVFRSGQWWLDGNGDFAWTGAPDKVFWLGGAGDVPIVGDWDNTGVRRVGVFRSGQWWIDMNNDGVWDAQHDVVFWYGQAGDIPVVGDWDHTGVQRIGIFRNGQWWLDINGDRQWDSTHDIAFSYGQAGDVPLVADWDSTGWQRIGVFRSGQWWIDLNGDHVWDSAHDQVFSYGAAGDIPVIGDWTHTNQTRIGVFRKAQWWLDMNGDHIWDATHDTAPLLGIASDVPVVVQ
jgi:uncharacterized repeat protein (TIGR01451 family)